MRWAVCSTAGIFAVFLAGTSLAACARASPDAVLADGPTGPIAVRSVTLTMPQFLTGAPGGLPVELAGELTLPWRGPWRLPAVVIVHSVVGVGPHERWWAQELNSVGLATFVLDSFTGRGLSDLREQPGRFGPLLAIVDVYRALEVLAAHPRIDPGRIAVMGFSYGGIVSLYAGLRRFHRLHGPPRVAFAAHVAFYPLCTYRLLDDERVTDRPIRVLHGTADDWTPIGPCRDYVARLGRAGKDVQLIEFPGAHHAFDVRQLPALRRLPHILNPSDCVFAERDGRLVDPATGRPRRPDDPCWTRGVTMGFHASAAQQATAATTAFLAAALRAGW